MEVLSAVLTNVPRVKLLVYTRTNVFRVAIASHGTGHEKPDCMPPSKVGIVFSMHNFACELPHVLRYEENLRQVQSELRVAGWPVLRIVYEELLADAKGRMAQVAQFLGLPASAAALLVGVAQQ